jgi:hypothetical protein
VPMPRDTAAPAPPSPSAAAAGPSPTNPSATFCSFHTAIIGPSLPLVLAFLVKGRVRTSKSFRPELTKASR